MFVDSVEQLLNKYLRNFKDYSQATLTVSITILPLKKGFDNIRLWLSPLITALPKYDVFGTHMPTKRKLALKKKSFSKDTL